MKRFAFICIVLFSLTLSAEPAFNAVEAAKRYPDADTLLLKDKTWSRYYPNGTSVETNDEYTVILTEKGRRESLTRSYGYMKQYGSVKILCAEVISQDGSVSPLDIAANCKEMIDSSQMSSNIFDPNAKEIRLAFPKLEIFDTVHLTVERITSKARVPNTWSDYSLLEWDCPIVFCEISITAPKELPLANIRLRSELDNKTEYSTYVNDDGSIRHTWTARNVPQAFPEPDMPPMFSVVRRLLVSTIPDWKFISKWYWNLSKPRLDAVSDEMKSAVSNLVVGAKDEDEKIRRIFSFVSQNIRYMGLTLEDEAPGYEPHDVSLTFGNRYGVCRDKAALLVSMLRLAGLNAYPVLINVGPRKDPDVPQPYFNHAIVAVERATDVEDILGPEGSTISSRYILLDPTDEKTKDFLPGYLRNMSYLVAKPDGEILLDTGAAPADKNLLKINTLGTLDDNGTLTLNTKVIFDGVNDNVYRNFFSRRKPDERKRYFEGALSSSLPSALMLGFKITPDDLSDTSKSLEVEFSCVAKNYPIEGSEAVMLKLPWLGESVGVANWVVGKTGLLKRRFPFVTEPTCGVDESIEIAVDKKYNVSTFPPKSTLFETEGILFSRNINAEPDTGIVHASERFHIKSTEFSTNQYQVLRENLKTIEIERKKDPVFTIQDKPADIRVISCNVSIDVASMNEWTNTVHRKVKVITYAGKKNCSEISMPFNPVWDELEILKATVTAPDGSVKEISDKEINIMDAAWTASAPRYPSGKILIANLPGVEIGSEIETVVRKTEKNRSFCSAMFSLAEYNPIDEMTIAISSKKNVDRAVAASVLKQKTPDVSIVDIVENGIEKRVYTRKNIPPIPVEDGQLPMWMSVPTVFVSTCSNGISEVFQKRFDEIISNPASTNAVSHIVSEIVSSEMPLIDRIKAIRDYVAKNIRIAGPSPYMLPLSSLSSVSTTIRDGYGHRADTALVLMSMLKEAGIKYKTLFVASTPFKKAWTLNDGVFGQNNAVDAIIIEIEIPNGLTSRKIWLNESDEYGELGTTRYNGYCYYTGDDQSIAGIINENNSNADLETKTVITLDCDGNASLEYSITLRDSLIGAFRKRYSEMTPEEFVRNHQELVAAFSPSAIADGELDVDVEGSEAFLKMRVNIPDYATRVGNMLILEIPSEGSPISLRSEIRKTSWCSSIFRTTANSCSVVMPNKSCEIAMMPPNYAMSFGGVEYSLHSTIVRGDDGFVKRIDVDGQYKTCIPEFSANEYSALFAMLRKLAHPEHRTLIINLME